MVIYKITNPNNRVYIGQTVDWERRKHEYTFLYKSQSQTALHNSFVKYGIDAHKFEVIEEVDNESLLDERERYYQEKFNVLGENGLNCRYVTTDQRTGRLSDATRKKISIANKGKKRTPEMNLAMSLLKKGKSNANKGRPSPKKGIPLTEEHKQNISKANQGNRSKPVFDKILDKSFTSIREWRKETGLSYHYFWKRESQGNAYYL